MKRPSTCPDCECSLNLKEVRQRSGIETASVIAKKGIYQCERGICQKCLKVFSSKPPFLPKNLYGNSLIAKTLVMHFIHGMTMGKVLEVLGQAVSLGGLIDCFHRMGTIFETAKPFLIEEYRSAICKHVDETGWRTDGHSEFAWIFCTPFMT